jgi:hypothetical protein
VCLGEGCTKQQGSRSHASKHSGHSDRSLPQEFRVLVFKNSFKFRELKNRELEFQNQKYQIIVTKNSCGKERSQEGLKCKAVKKIDAVEGSVLRASFLLTHFSQAHLDYRTAVFTPAEALNILDREYF